MNQVMPIWEGTTNVLSLDVLRAIDKSHGSVLMSYNKEVTERLARIKLTPAEELHDSVNKVYQSLDRTMTFAQQHTDKLELAARDFAFSLSRIYMGKLLTYYMHMMWVSTNRLLELDNELTQTDKRSDQKLLRI